MTKSFQKTLIAASVGVILAAGSFSANAGTPGTTNLLFPFITTETGSFTFISISNTGTSGARTPYHFTYATKAVVPGNTNNTAACTHLDGDATATGNDLMQFEVQNKVPFTAFGGTSVAKFFPNTPDAANQRGMLIVNNAVGSNYGSGATYAGVTLYGEARIINTLTGLATGYSTDDLHTANAAFTTTSGGPDFASIAGPDGGAVNSTKIISWFPVAAVNTSFFVIPLADEQVMSFTGNAYVQYQARDSLAVFGGHYDNKEGFQSSTAVAGVTCVGTFSRADLLGALNAPFSNNGGWATFARTGGAFAGTVAATTALIYKLENTTALGGNVSFITRAPTK